MSKDNIFFFAESQKGFVHSLGTGIGRVTLLQSLMIRFSLGRLGFKKGSVEVFPSFFYQYSNRLRVLSDLLAQSLSILRLLHQSVTGCQYLIGEISNSHGLFALILTNGSLLSGKNVVKR